MWFRMLMFYKGLPQAGTQKCWRGKLSKKQFKCRQGRWRLIRTPLAISSWYGRRFVMWERLWSLRQFEGGFFVCNWYAPRFYTWYVTQIVSLAQYEMELILLFVRRMCDTVFHDTMATLCFLNQAALPWKTTPLCGWSNGPSSASLDCLHDHKGE